jgi:hypothetical protein
MTEQTLIQECKSVHQDILAAARNLRRVVEQEQSAGAYAQPRMALATIVRERLPDQQRLLAAIRPDTGIDIVDYEKLLEEERELRLAYSQHISAWNGRAVDEDHSAYAAAVCRLVERLETYFRNLENWIDCGLGPFGGSGLGREGPRYGDTGRLSVS